MTAFSTLPDASLTNVSRTSFSARKSSVSDCGRISAFGDFGLLYATVRGNARRVTEGKASHAAATAGYEPSHDADVRRE